MTALTVRSLFSGIGGLELGLERAGMTTKWQVEQHGYATRVLAKHWPHVPRFRDVRDVGAHNLKPVDLICGGFPCQDISNAGKRAGISGERSGLWREFARIIRELRPRYALIENVAALVYRGLDTVLCDLAACGYDAEWQIVSAASVGAPHLRERLFIVAYPNSIGVSWRWLGQRGSSCDSWNRETYRQYPFASHQGFAQAPVWQEGNGTDFRVANGVSARIHALGNAVVPQVAEYIGRCIIEHSRGVR